MKYVVLASVIAAAGACSGAQAQTFQGSTQVIACNDLQSVAQTAQSLGLQAQVQPQGVAIATKGGNHFGVAVAEMPAMGGCFGMVFVATLGPDSGSHGAAYANFNSSDTNGFGAVALNFGGQIALARSAMTKYGSIGGNLELEIELFAERTDALAAAISGTALNTAPAKHGPDANGLASATASPFPSPAFADAARAILKSDALAHPGAGSKKN